jgi:mannose-6-phosphate isomerase-like protein (cupin superfamily)
MVIAGQSHGFGPDSTLVVPARVIHQLIHTGDEPMLLIASLSASPAQVFARDGSELALTWLS